MISIQKIIAVIQEEIDKIEWALDDVGDDGFIRLASEQSGLERVLCRAKEVAHELSGLVLATNYYNSLPYEITCFPTEDGSFTAAIPDLPGCISRGTTEEEALAGIKKAKARWIEEALNRLHPIPMPGEGAKKEHSQTGRFNLLSMTGKDDIDNMPIIKDMLLEEYLRLTEKLEVYLAKPANPSFQKTIEGIREDIKFIEMAFLGNNLDLADEVKKSKSMVRGNES